MAAARLAQESGGIRQQHEARSQDLSAARRDSEAVGSHPSRCRLARSSGGGWVKRVERLGSEAGGDGWGDGGDSLAASGLDVAVFEKARPAGTGNCSCESNPEMWRCGVRRSRFNFPPSTGQWQHTISTAFSAAVQYSNTHALALAFLHLVHTSTGATPREQTAITAVDRGSLASSVPQSSHLVQHCYIPKLTALCLVQAISRPIMSPNSNPVVH
jgi:hypothetical protein